MAPDGTDPSDLFELQLARLAAEAVAACGPAEVEYGGRTGTAFVVWVAGPSLQAVTDVLGVLGIRARVDRWGALAAEVEGVSLVLTRRHPRAHLVGLALSHRALDEAARRSMVLADLEADRSPGEVELVAATLLCDRLGLSPSEPSDAALALFGSAWDEAVGELVELASHLVS